jgi:ferredoxin
MALNGLRMKISVDRERCCGSGVCVTIAPELFGQHEADGLVVLRNFSSADFKEKRARAAASACPTSAIRLQGLES